jgi:hypothetical protein
MAASKAWGAARAFKNVVTQRFCRKAGVALVFTQLLHRRTNDRQQGVHIIRRAEVELGPQRLAGGGHLLGMGQSQLDTSFDGRVGQAAQNLLLRLAGQREHVLATTGDKTPDT